MSTSKFIKIICGLFAVVAVVIAVLFLNGVNLGIVSDDSVSLAYVDKIFDDSIVHTIEIKIDDWNNFIDTATNETYSSIDVTIDGETIKDVGLRAKGNTSLTTVKQLDSDRYSMKIEFDCFQANKLYHGLDKLCLNNLIQDNTMMKDYLTYKMMNENGVPAPLASFAYVKVNDEDWGLFLAVEAVEDSFLERNYGRAYGNLYKPDSTEMGGGRGNGGGFNMKEVDFEKMGMENPFENINRNNQFPNIASFSDMRNMNQRGFGRMRFNIASGSSIASRSDMRGGPFGGGGPGMGMGSDDAKLKYIDDEIDSYSNIFDNEKTNSKKVDKKRLIKALRYLSEGIANHDAELIKESVNIDEMYKYMVVHNFVVNGDSYTGNMIHNFYLYEENGLISMFPWDYNLAYGGFQSNDASAAVNDPIDTPLSITDGDTDRPAFDWIISNEEFTKEYHEYFKNFIDQMTKDNYLQNEIDKTYKLIYEYVDKDPTKFCTLEEFELAVKAIKTYISLRIESVKGQLDGSIPSTDSGQNADSSNLIDIGTLTLSDMGSMGFGGGRDRNKQSGEGFGGPPDMQGRVNGFGGPPEMQGEMGGFGAPPDFANMATRSNMGGGFGGPPGSMSGNISSVTNTDYIWTFASVIAILLGIAFAYNFNKKW